MGEDKVGLTPGTTWHVVNIRVFVSVLFRCLILFGANHGEIRI